MANKDNSSRQGQWWQTRTMVADKDNSGEQEGGRKGGQRDQRQTQMGERGERQEERQRPEARGQRPETRDQ